MITCQLEEGLDRLSGIATRLMLDRHHDEVAVAPDQREPDAVARARVAEEPPGGDGEGHRHRSEKDRLIPGLYEL